MSSKRSRPLRERDGLEGLKALRRQVRNGDPRAGGHKPAAEKVVEKATAGDEGEDRLLAQAFADVAPLPDSNRVILQPPRPHPVPRPRSAEAPEDAAPSRLSPRAPTDPWQEAIRGVQLQPSTGRVDPDRLGRPRHTAELHIPEAPPPAAGVDDPLLAQIYADVQPLADSGRAEVGRPQPEPLPKQREADARETLRETLETPLSFEDRLDMGQEPAFLRPGLRRSVLTDLRRGRWVVQRELDLHGLTRDEARLALSTFLQKSLQQGLRCMRVIHGKGLGSPGKESILRQLSRAWLAQREEILAFCQARPHEGGEGALIVLLRSPRPAGGRHRDDAETDATRN